MSRLRPLIAARQIRGAILLAGLAAGVAAAQDAPKIQFERTVCDLGKVIEGQECSGKFSFRNDGTALLQIGQAETTCGCTVASVLPDKLQPGQTGLIAFTLDLTNVRGPTQKGITIPSNDPKTPIVMLTGETRVDRVAVAIADGADSYIAKPISAKILMSHLIKLILADRPVHYLD